MTTPGDLIELGLAQGDQVRFRLRENEHWHPGVVECRERDGSIRVRDTKGAARAITIDRLEVRTRGPRGGSSWEPVALRAERSEQLRLI